ncbi:hypothetical protein B0F90DRAFT_1787105 [Multifurca ochricompacta]|uniref:Methyltransferase domain-containing protein n=1 Tax=Multifurca ochricompacta TaxID=376703 RepID=A0AAD4QIY1_9AGAM|nr:hypothetical protein B0F90DRAFT_1787105 [Multifurca ochricompacta]
MRSPYFQRQEAQHILLRMITGRNYDAPLRELLNENLDERKVVIDLCTGAGHWVLEMAREFPHVAFRGLDRVPIQTRYPPDNVRFEIVDVTERLRFADASIDVVHARMVCLRVRRAQLFLSAEWSVYPTLHPEHPCFTDYKALIPRTISFHNAVSSIVPTLAPHIIRLIGLTNSFEEPVSTRRAIPISVPYLSTASPELHFVSGVMQRIVRGYANALVAGGFVQSEDANAFKQELDSTYGIVSIYQTVFARKRTQGN